MRRRLLRSAKEAFLEGGYRQASVAGICRKAGVANGTFYQYFADKDAVFAELAGSFRELLVAELRQAVGRARDLRGRVQAVAAALSDVLERESGLVQVFREAEFVDAPTSDAFYSLLQEELPTLVQAPGIDSAALSTFLLGAAYFTALSRSVWAFGGPVLPAVLDFVQHGMAGPGASRRSWLPALRAPLARPARRVETADSVEPSGRAAATQRRILLAAEELFGALGYHGCGVARVAEAAGVGQGTVYLHFKGKQALLEQLVRRTSWRLKAAVATAVAGETDRLRIEVLGLRAVLAFFEEHRGMYRIVREAEFVERELGRWYYMDLAEGYRLTLEPAMAAGQVRSMDPTVLGLALMGVSHHLGLRWPVRAGAAVPEHILGSVVELVMGGVLGAAREEVA